MSSESPGQTSKPSNLESQGIVVVRANELEFEPASHEAVDNPGVFKKVLFARAKLPAGQLQMVNWAKLPAGKSFRLHFHEDMHEIFVVVQGSAEMSLCKSQVTLGPGDAILVPPNVAHSMRSLDQQEVDYVVFGVTQDRGGKTVVVGEP